MALVAGLVGVAVCLVGGAYTFVASLREALAVDFGFRSTTVLNVGFDLEPYGYTPERGRDFLVQLSARLRESPAVRSAALLVPAGGMTTKGAVYFDKRPVKAPEFVAYHSVDPSYFESLGIPVLRGRTFGDADGPGEPAVAVVSDSLARLLTGEAEILGHSLWMSTGAVTVVGVVRNVLYDVRHLNKYVIYLPLSQAGQWLGVRARLLVEARNVREVRRTLARSISSLDPRVMPASVRSVEEMLRSQYALQDLAAEVMGVLGALAGCLSAIGMHSLISLIVRLRRHEIAVRVALGASTVRVLRMLSVSIGVPVLLGSLVGSASLWTASILVTRHTAGMQPATPAALVFAVATVVVLSLGVCTRVALAAAHTSPQSALRQE